MSSIPSKSTSAATCADRAAPPVRHFFRAHDYNLAATLNSGQAFRWHPHKEGWASVIRGRWVKLTQRNDGIEAEVADPQADWQWLEDYLQVHVDLETIVRTFPDDPPMRAAVSSCRGLRLLRQDPWECLASFILSSTKQIVQIRQIVGTLCERYGEPVVVPPGELPVFAFPTPARLAALCEPDLRNCKMGFRAPYLLGSARLAATGEVDLAALARSAVSEARERLILLPGVGRKIADCVLLFAYGFPTAFPLDVWVLRALRELYFKGKRPTMTRMRAFSESHFGPNAGYAQQYLFHYVRTRGAKNIFRRPAR